MFGNFIFGKLLLIVFLIICAISDLKIKKVDFYVITGMYIIESAIYIYMFLFKIEIYYMEIIFGITIGLIMLFFSKISNESLGYGDGFVFIALGAGIGGENLIGILLFSVLSICLYGLISIFINRIRLKNTRTFKLPFLPFVLPAVLYACISI